MLCLIAAPIWTATTESAALDTKGFATSILGATLASRPMRAPRGTPCADSNVTGKPHRTSKTTYTTFIREVSSIRTDLHTLAGASILCAKADVVGSIPVFRVRVKQAR